MNDILIGFEIISSDFYHILDSSPLQWHSPYLFDQGSNTFTNDSDDVYVINSNIFTGTNLYIKIAYGNIFISNFNQEDEINFFERIASTVIPEIDEFNQEE